MDADLLIPLAGMATVVVLALPIVRSIVRISEKKIVGRGDGEELKALREDVRILQDRMERLEFGDDRVAELEERLDFAERMLAQHREAPKIGGEG